LIFGVPVAATYRDHRSRAAGIVANHPVDASLGEQASCIHVTRRGGLVEGRLTVRALRVNGSAGCGEAPKFLQITRPRGLNYGRFGGESGGQA